MCIYLYLYIYIYVYTIVYRMITGPGLREAEPVSDRPGRREPPSVRHSIRSMIASNI